jgi:hypothetical protein
MSRTDRATTINSILRDVVVSESATALAGVFKTSRPGRKAEFDGLQRQCRVGDQSLRVASASLPAGDPGDVACAKN